ncbi:DUF5034 domain-containing protein [Bacteroides salyersiae]|uniref:DUF5034 domain-containing protein n=1 Tax=Bacteroides salyersiae TaxID=291644 RepID=UPI0009D93F38|nr:DUF5034 domain-containing protein [Bacteroides salyersiae]RHF01861.1 DUF5034 domain-containing protein [Bacteroides salyersiae]
MYTKEPLNNDFPKGTDVTSCFADYPFRLTGHQIKDCTLQGDTIQYMSPIKQIFKALMIAPQTGNHRFQSA